MKAAKKSIKLVSELMGYCFDHGMEQVQVDVKHDNKQVDISVQGEIEDFSLKKIEELEISLNTPRETQVEEYYWELAGENNQSQELSLVGMMTDNAEVNYENNRLEIRVSRTE